MRTTCDTATYHSGLRTVPSLAVRRVPQEFKQDRSDQSDLTDLTEQERWTLYAPWLDHPDPAVRANATLCLIHQANYLLDQQIETLERAFIEGGGYREQLATARLAERERKRAAGKSEKIPPCPRCKRPLVLRTVKAGPKAGEQFWGCPAYPECKGTAKL
jgi:restriction system protein